MATVAAEPADSGIFTRERVLTVALALITLIAIYLCYLIIEPFIPALVFSLALAVATNKPYVWLRRRFKSQNLAAAVGVLCVAVLIIVPIVLLATYLVGSAMDNINQLRGTGLQDLQTKLENQPYIGPYVRLAEERLRIQEQVGNIAQHLASRFGSLLAGSVGVLTQLIITLFVLFFLYRDRDVALNTARKMVPLAANESRRLFDTIANTIQATVNGSVIVSCIQAVGAGIVYVLLGVPGAVIWAACTFFGAFVPVFGTATVWVPIALYLAVTGSWGKALILTGWASIAVGSIDNILYPFLVGDKMRLHTVPTFFAVLGGVGLFGLSGLILGPMTVAVTIGLLDVWFRRTEQGQAAEQVVTQQPNQKPPADLLEKSGRDTSDQPV